MSTTDISTSAKDCTACRGSGEIDVYHAGVRAPERIACPHCMATGKEDQRLPEPSEPGREGWGGV